MDAKVAFTKLDNEMMKLEAMQSVKRAIPKGMEPKTTKNTAAAGISLDGLGLPTRILGAASVNMAIVAGLPTDEIEATVRGGRDQAVSLIGGLAGSGINTLQTGLSKETQLKSEIRQGVVAQTAQAVKTSADYFTSGLKTQAYTLAHTFVPSLENYRGNMSEMKNAYTQAQGLTKLQIAGGMVASHLSGDLGDVQKPIDYDANGPAILYINGMRTTDDQSKATRTFIGRYIDVKTIGRIENNTHIFGLGDAFQVLSHEAGMIDITSIRAAQAMRQGILEKGEVYVIAHSQGTAISKSALRLLTPEERQHVHYQGYGGQTYIDAKETGIAEAINVRHERDGVPYVGNDIKDLAALSPSMTLSPFNYGYNAMFRREDQRDWKIIREESIRGLDLNQFWNIGRHHDMDTKYVNQIVKQWEVQ